MSKTAFSQSFRNVNITIQNEPNVSVSIDCYYAILDWVERIESVVKSGTVSQLRDLDITEGTQIIIPSKVNNKAYLVTSDGMAADSGDYPFTINAEYPTFEEAQIALEA